MIVKQRFFYGPGRVIEALNAVALALQAVMLFVAFVSLLVVVPVVGVLYALGGEWAGAVYVGILWLLVGPVILLGLYQAARGRL